MDVFGRVKLGAVGPPWGSESLPSQTSGHVVTHQTYTGRVLTLCVHSHAKTAELKGSVLAVSRFDAVAFSPELTATQIAFCTARFIRR